jgi:ribosomal protein S18 acetylase RimI-like enzyme
MKVRRAGPEDFAGITALWRDFDEEVPPPAHVTVDVEKELEEIVEILASETAFLAEADDGTAVGFVLGRRRSEGFGTLTDLYVAPHARRGSVATELVRELVNAFDALGIEQLDLDVQTTNAVARSVYARWGLRDDVVVMTGSIAELKERLGGRETSSFGSIHVQSSQRLGRRLRRRLRPRPVDAAPTRT